MFVVIVLVLLGDFACSERSDCSAGVLLCD